MTATQAGQPAGSSERASSSRWSQMSARLVKRTAGIMSGRPRPSSSFWGGQGGAGRERLRLGSVQARTARGRERTRRAQASASLAGARSRPDMPNPTHIANSWHLDAPRPHVPHVARERVSERAVHDAPSARPGGPFRPNRSHWLAVVSLGHHGRGCRKPRAIIQDLRISRILSAGGVLHPGRAGLWSVLLHVGTRELARAHAQ